MRPLAALLLLLIAAAAFGAENGKTIDTPSGTLYYETMGGGSATPLLMINGGPGFKVRSRTPPLRRSRRF